jgi:nitrate/nitrite transporter NarK
LIQGSFIGFPLIIIMIILPFGLGSITPLVLTIPFELKELPQIAAGAAIGIVFTMGSLGGFIWPIVAGKVADLTGAYHDAYLIANPVEVHFVKLQARQYDASTAEGGASEF